MNCVCIGLLLLGNKMGPICCGLIFLLAWYSSWLACSSTFTKGTERYISFFSRQIWRIEYVKVKINNNYACSSRPRMLLELHILQRISIWFDLTVFPRMIGEHRLVILKCICKYPCIAVPKVLFCTLSIIISCAVS